MITIPVWLAGCLMGVDLAMMVALAAVIVATRSVVRAAIDARYTASPQKPPTPPAVPAAPQAPEPVSAAVKVATAADTAPTRIRAARG